MYALALFFLGFFFGPLCAYVILFLVFCSLWFSPYFLCFPQAGGLLVCLGVFFIFYFLFLCFTFCLCLQFHTFSGHGVLMAFPGLVVFCFVPFLLFFCLYCFLGFPRLGVCLFSFGFLVCSILFWWFCYSSVCLVLVVLLFSCLLCLLFVFFPWCSGVKAFLTFLFLLLYTFRRIYLFWG